MSFSTNEEAKIRSLMKFLNYSDRLNDHFAYQVIYKSYGPGRCWPLKYDPKKLFSDGKLNSSVVSKDSDGLIIENPFSKEEDEEEEDLPLVQSLMNKRQKIVELADSELGKDPKKAKKITKESEVETEEEERDTINDINIISEESNDESSDDKVNKYIFKSIHDRFLQPYWYQFDYLNRKEDERVKDEIENQLSIDIENVWEKIYEYHLSKIKKPNIRKLIPPLSIDYRTHKLVVDLVFDFMDTLIERASDIISQYAISEGSMRASYTIVPDILRIMCFSDDFIDKVQNKLDSLYSDEEFCQQYVYSKKRMDGKKKDEESVDNAEIETAVE